MYDDDVYCVRTYAVQVNKAPEQTMDSKDLCVRYVSTRSDGPELRTLRTYFDTIIIIGVF